MTEIIHRPDIWQRLQYNHPMILVEALPQSYYLDRHLPGARWLPRDASDSMIQSVLPDQNAMIVVYCSNHACQNSHFIAQKLAAMGYRRVYQYKEGKQDWIEAGLPTETVQQSAA